MVNTPRITHLRTEDFKRTPWKNGLGWTDQIGIHPEGADLRRGDFAWRVSTARITQSADFSPFAEHDRVLVVLEGGGVRLAHRFEESDEPEFVELEVLQPYEFPGDVPTRCELLEGPIQDFSVFVRKGMTSAMVDVNHVSGEFAWEPSGRTAFAFVAAGTVTTEYGFRLERGHALRADCEAGDSLGPIVLSPVPGGEPATLVFVQLDHG